MKRPNPTEAGRRDGEPVDPLPPLSSFGDKVRRALRIATYLIPFVWIATFLVGRAAMGAAPSIGLLVACLFVGFFYLPLVLIAWLVFLVFFRLRAYLIEMILILSAISLPPGMLISGAGVQYGLTESFLKFCLLFCLSICLLGTGGVWGLSVSQRYGEERTWVRLGYILLGWAMLTGFLASGGLAWSILSLLKEAHLAQDIRLAWIVLAISSILVLAAVFGVIVERRCRKIHGPIRV